jgi:hypothetical protein
MATITVKLPGDETARPHSYRELLAAMVAHVKDAQEDILVAAEGQTHYVGRQGGARRGRFGNPYSHDQRSTAPFKVANRAEAVASFERWIGEPAQAELRADIEASLHRKVLLCHCQRQADTSPACHAEVLVRLANPDYAELAAKEEKARPPMHLELHYPVQFQTFIREHGMAENPCVIVSGDRNWKAADVVVEAVREFGPGVVVIEGEASGADELARDAALEQLHVPVAGFPARWDPTPSTPPSWIKVRNDGKRYVPRAGILRNQTMLDAAGDQLQKVVAFHDNIRASKGTGHMVRAAWAAGKTVELVNSSGERRVFAPEGPGTLLPEELAPYDADLAGV